MENHVWNKVRAREENMKIKISEREIEEKYKN
jgi:hypothetical protein